MIMKYKTRSEREGLSSEGEKERRQGRGDKVKGE